jgi:hypothetical protein
MPEDEKKQVEAASGEAFDIDSIAIGNFTAQGPKWVLKAQDEPVLIGGFNYIRKGVWQDFLITTPDAWGANWFAVTRHCRRAMDAMFQSGQAHRIQCIVPVKRLKERPELAKWYKVIGYTREALMYGYYANGADAYSYARVKH